LPQGVDAHQEIALANVAFALEGTLTGDHMYFAKLGEGETLRVFH
jgi:hypothetical protein